MEEDFYEEQPMALTVGPLAVGFLRTTAKWGKFLAVVGFVMIGLVVLLALFGGAYMGTMMSGALHNGMSGFMGTFFTVMYLLFALLYFFPVLYLYKFSAQMLRGLEAESPALVEESFKNLKSLFKFLGVLTALILGFYLVVVLFGLGALGISALYS